MHCHMGPGVRNGLLGAKQPTGPAGRLPFPLNRPCSTLPCHSQNLYGQQSWGEWEEHIHGEWVIRRHWDATIAQVGVTYGEFLSKASHFWACDRQHMFVYNYQGEPNGPPGQGCQVIRTHQQGSTNEFSVSLPMRAIPGDEKATHQLWCPDLRDPW